ncbi:MAG: hypothetical protein RJA25_2244 [Bacteroidota bacterium]
MGLTNKIEMLDTQTKKNIDDCRNVLVGKVPDPKSQIEQITLALIYKFMDDMDKEAVEKFKGKAKFFTGEYDKYGWRKLFDPSLSGQDMLALYSEALEKLNTNPNIPELFRNIFKNAYLPYRDPATLKLFLKHINEFEYSHSEKLGDAFEYLLSVMGSQGDAGQFRTPRHIIDFVTACVNPQKNETVLDPACGTAGFLLSAYKHILNNSIKNDELRITEDTSVIRNSKFVIGLTPDERRKLGQNIVGYDISPDMVRLSLANMYLHGFATPLIHEYDSLSSEDRWQETFDVILANPPFMTPKGGIRPHKKFGVQANKAEVLFTDYIAEHLNPNGRAGIVVPNGIVATSQTAYKQLRKMLVQDSLIAVISLPAGVFQPYSGVKTSVLILDKKLAKKSQHILFLKIENDGFDLGAQRREIDKNDLPLALEILQQYKEALLNGVSVEEIEAIIKNPKDSKDSNNPNNPKNPKDSNNYSKSNNATNTTPLGSNLNNPTDIINIKSLRDSLATLVEKETVLGNKDVVLSGERYFKNDELKITNYELVRLEDVAEVISGQSPESSNYNDKGEGLPFYQGRTDFGQIFLEAPTKWTTQITKEAYKNDILMSVRAPVGPVNIATEKICIGRGLAAIRPKENIEQFYLFYMLRSLNGIIKGNGGAVFDSISRDQIKEIEIPLPPLEIQQQIVAEIEGYQKIIDGAKQIVNNYKPTIKINPDWEMLELGTLAKIKGGYAFKSNEFVDSGIQVLKISNVKTGRLDLEKNPAFMPFERKGEFVKYLIKEGDILITMTGTEGKRDYGDVCLVTNKGEYLLNQRVGKVELNSAEVSREYLALAMMSPIYQNEIFKKATGVRQSNVSGTDLEEIKIPLPALSEQQTIVKAIEEELQLVNANKRLIKIFEQKIKTKIGEVWGVKNLEVV